MKTKHLYDCHSILMNWIIGNDHNEAGEKLYDIILDIQLLPLRVFMELENNLFEKETTEAKIAILKYYIDTLSSFQEDYISILFFWFKRRQQTTPEAKKINRGLDASLDMYENIFEYIAQLCRISSVDYKKICKELGFNLSMESHAIYNIEDFLDGKIYDVKKINDSKEPVKDFQKYSNIQFQQNEELKKLSLSEIALLCFYNGKSVTRNNAKEVANDYGRKYGEKLYLVYTYYSKLKNRISSESTKLKTDNKLALFAKIIPMLSSTEAKQHAIRDYDTLKAKV